MVHAVSKDTLPPKRDNSTDKMRDVTVMIHNNVRSLALGVLCLLTLGKFNLETKNFAFGHLPVLAVWIRVGVSTGIEVQQTVLRIVVENEMKIT